MYQIEYRKLLITADTGPLNAPIKVIIGLICLIQSFRSLLINQKCLLDGSLHVPSYFT